MLWSMIEGYILTATRVTEVIHVVIGRKISVLIYISSQSKDKCNPLKTKDGVIQNL